MVSPQKRLGMSRKQYREAHRKAEKERRPASYWLQRMDETDGKEPDLWEFCAHELYGVSYEEMNARTKQVAHETIGDRLINLADFKKVVLGAFGMTVPQADEKIKSCRKMYAERNQGQA